MPRSVGYDPCSWLVWGRELARGRLDTSDAHRRKPYPVFLNAVFAWTGSALRSLIAVILVFCPGWRGRSFPAGVIAFASTRDVPCGTWGQQT